MEKVIRDGKVAVLHSPDGWYSEHYSEQLLFHPKVVEMVEAGRKMEIDKDWIFENTGVREVYADAMRLEIVWIPEGTLFHVTDYGEGEEIVLKNQIHFLTA